MIRVFREDVDLDQFEQVKIVDIPQHQQNNPAYLPTHFIMEKVDVGDTKGFDKVTYLRKKTLNIVARTKVR